MSLCLAEIWIQLNGMRNNSTNPPCFFFVACCVLCTCNQLETSLILSVSFRVFSFSLVPGTLILSFFFTLQSTNWSRRRRQIILQHHDRRAIIRKSKHDLRSPWPWTLCGMFYVCESGLHCTERDESLRLAWFVSGWQVGLYSTVT